MALQTDLTSDEELSTTIDLSDAQVRFLLSRLASVMVLISAELSSERIINKLSFTYLLGRINALQYVQHRFYPKF